jgi:hypothetical protein
MNSAIPNLFGEARGLLNEAGIPNFNDEWLYDLESDAEDGNTDNYIATLKGFFRRLHAVGVIGIEHIDDLDNIINDCCLIE